MCFLRMCVTITLSVVLCCVVLCCVLCVVSVSMFLASTLASEALSSPTWEPADSEVAAMAAAVQAHRAEVNTHLPAALTKTSTLGKWHTAVTHLAQASSPRRRAAGCRLLLATFDAG